MKWRSVKPFSSHRDGHKPTAARRDPARSASVTKVARRPSAGEHRKVVVRHVRKLLNSRHPREIGHASVSPSTQNSGLAALLALWRRLLSCLKPAQAWWWWVGVRVGWGGVCVFFWGGWGWIAPRPQQPHRSLSTDRPDATEHLKRQQTQTHTGTNSDSTRAQWKSHRNAQASKARMSDAAFCISERLRRKAPDNAFFK